MDVLEHPRRGMPIRQMHVHLPHVADMGDDREPV